MLQLKSKNAGRYYGKKEEKCLNNFRHTGYIESKKIRDIGLHASFSKLMAKKLLQRKFCSKRQEGVASYDHLHPVGIWQIHR